MSTPSAATTVCIFCGSDEYQVPTSSCAHGATATVSKSLAKRLASKLAESLRAVEISRRNFLIAAQAEVHHGTGEINDRPAVVSPGNNVVFLRQREPLKSPQGEPLTTESFRRQGLL